MKSNFFSYPYFHNEDEFRDFLAGRLQSDAWHVQVHRGDPAYPGIPDLSAGGHHTNAWIECKLSPKIARVDEKMQIQHPLSAQQEWWLKQRDDMAKVTHCGIALPFRVGIPGDHQTYVTYCPVSDWRARMNEWTLHAWVLSPFTANILDLVSSKATVLDLLRGTLTPGWAGRTPVQREYGD